jgi:hypothetical protein
MLNNDINLIFITPSLLRTSFISVIQKLSRMLHPFGLMGTAIDEIYLNARRSTNGAGGVVYQFLGLILVILLI